jgi:Tol biopolymer transport system component
MRLVVAWLAVAALLVVGARLLGQAVPSNGQIAYVVKRGIHAQVRVIDAQTRIDQLITDLIDVDQIAWLPDRTLAFTRRHGENSRIMLIDLQSHTLRQLTNSAGFATNPSWSASGRWLAFQVNDASGADIYVINANGDNLRRLTSAPGFDGDPAWSPGGDQIAFLSSRDGSADLYVMDPDGNNIRRLTNDTAREEHPAWSPDGKYIALPSRLMGRPTGISTCWRWQPERFAN